MTCVLIMTSAQRSRSGTMKHDAMLHYASFDVKLPKSIHSDYVISFSATPHDLVCFYDLVTLFDLYCT